MTNGQWKEFFEICHSFLGKGEFSSILSESWCSWTTFSRLNQDAKYWAAGLPNDEDIGEVGINDGGTWGQPFKYQEIAHLIIPRKFYWETEGGPTFQFGYKEQDIAALSKTLIERQLPHRLTDLVLEVKCY